MARNLFSSPPLLAAAVVQAAIFDFAYLALMGNGWVFLAWTLPLNGLFALMWFRWLAHFRLGRSFLVPMFIVLDCVALYFARQYRLPIDANSFAFLVESDISESREFISAGLVAWLGVSLACGFVVRRMLMASSFDRSPHSAWGGVLAVAAVIALTWKGNGSVNPANYQGPLPFTMAEAMAVYAVERVEFRWRIAHERDISTLPVTRRGDDLEAVLIIGESARSASFEINGYGRPTNPRLKQWPIISYPDSRACGTSTRISVPCLVTRATVADHGDMGKETSFLSVFRALGYQTAWISNQRLLGQYDSPTYAFAAEAEHRVFNQHAFASRRDDEIAGPVAAYLAALAPRRLTVIHTIGSHWHYANRYPPEFEKFQPACDGGAPPDCPLASLVNAYDNSILYTDSFIADVIAQLAGRRAFLIYVSDHGESLGEDGYFAHGNDARPEQKAVPFFFWASDSFKQSFPRRVEAAKALAGHSLSHDYIFHSMLGCAGISGEALDTSLSICGKSPD